MIMIIILLIIIIGIYYYDYYSSHHYYYYYYYYYSRAYAPNGPLTDGGHGPMPLSMGDGTRRPTGTKGP